MRPMIGAINDLESRMEALSDEELAAQTVSFKEQLAQGASLFGLLGTVGGTALAAVRRRIPFGQPFHRKGFARPYRDLISGKSTPGRVLAP